MLTHKNKVYLLSLLLVAALIAQSVSARTTSPVGNLEGGGALLPTGQVITPAAAPGSTFERLVLKGTPAVEVVEAIAGDVAISTGAVVAGVAASKDGKTLVAAKFENDSISIVDVVIKNTNSGASAKFNCIL